MLVISRNVGEAFVVGEAVVSVVSTRGGRVEVGIEAPRSVPVLRSELVAPVEMDRLMSQAREGHRC